MNGKKLKQLIDVSSFTVTEVAKRFNISREHLYKLYQKEDIGAEYTRLADDIGLTALDKKLQSDNSTSVVEIIERMRLDHEAEKKELYDIIKHDREIQKSLIAQLKKVK